MSTNTSRRALHPRQFGSCETAAEPESRIRVLIADDHAAVRAGVCRLLGEQPDMRIITEAASAISAVNATGALPQVAVIDYHLGDRNGLWVTRRPRQLDPSPRALVYSALIDDALALAAVVAGTDGLLSKSAIGEELCLAIRRLAARQHYLPSISPAVTRALSARLASRQQPLLAMLVHGISSQRRSPRSRLTPHARS